MRKTFSIILQVSLLVLIAGCDKKPEPVSPPSPTVQTNANTNAATNAEPAKEEEEVPQSKVARGESAMAVTVNPIATKAALNAMKEGGNAIDGAVAAALTLGVVDPHNSDIGGGCFILIRHGNG